MENIMLDTPKKNIKLVDFGLSNTFAKDELMKTHCGSPEYAAPELFTAGEKYGLEIDVWSLGVVMYAMLVGKLPFTTPYTDQYRRQKLVQQMEKGLVEVHNQEMMHLSVDCQDLLHKVIEPSPSIRLPLLDMEIHSWLTENGKKPFVPFQSFPRDKNMKSQDSISSADDDEAIEELAVALNMKKEVVDQKVAENKSDEMSAMFNMILDRKRQQQGVFDVDHTLKNEKKEQRAKRSKSAHARSGDKKHVTPPALLLPSDDMNMESAPHSGNEQDHETKFSSFDFLALCSTPTWLGPERRKSRRRSRSPMPSPHLQQHGTQGLSVRNQMKRDYMERQAIEMEREMIREEKAAAAALLSPNSAGQAGAQSQQQQNANEHTPVAASLSVPGTDPPAHSQLAFRRSSSFKLSRRRAKSCGPSHKRKSSFQRSGSVDHSAQKVDISSAKELASSLATTKEGSSAPVITGEIFGQTAEAKTGKTKRTSSLRRKLSVDTTVFANKNLLGVPSFDSHGKNHLTVPSEESPIGINLLSVPSVCSDSTQHLKVPEVEIGFQNSLSVQSPGTPNSPSEDSTSSLNGGKANSIPRPGKLILKECYPPKDNNRSKSNSHIIPVKPLISGANGPLTSVEVHYADCSNPNSSTDLLQPTSNSSLKADSLEVPRASAEGLSDFSDSFYLSQSELKGNDRLSSKQMLDSQAQKQDSFHPKLSSESLQPIASSQHTKNLMPNSNHLTISSCMEDGAIAMQIEDKSSSLCAFNENRVLLGAECPPFRCDPSGNEEVSDLQNHFDGLMMSSDCMEESDDHVDSMTELISDSFRHTILANAKPSASPGHNSIGVGASPKYGHQNSAPSPEEERALSKNSSRKGSGSIASFSRSSRSGSGRKSGSGKVKSPTTPNWMVLKTPLARIESFHSDDFECLADSDIDDRPCSSDSPMSVTTPTVPCFAYKLHMMKKKQTKLKNNNANNSGPLSKADHASSKMNRNSTEKKHASTGSGSTRVDATIMEPLLSSGSETEHQDEGQDRLGAPGKSKIHPMVPDDKDLELLSKSDTKCLPYTNAITRQPNQIKNSVNKCHKITPDPDQSGKKKTFVKNLAWKKSFAQFLKRKRYHSPIATTTQPQQQLPLGHQPQQQQQQQQQQPLVHQVQQHQHIQHQPAGNNNNNELLAPDPQPVSRNGMSVLVQQPAKLADASTGAEDPLLGPHEGENCKIHTTTFTSAPVESTMTELIELQSSPKPHCSPSPVAGRVFDFTLASDSPKIKSSCLLGWGSCRDCGRGEVSEEEDIECFSSHDPAVVNLSLKPLGETNVQENTSFTQTYSFSPT
ncbi:uncharacterized protein LOC101853251 isoform X2 [Aplysia californica]|uniref:Uncharacterized protein LOC101853251 isoform X2 n=1 Tax=Aplysia californica TaxID=6500 RepID=A0ABM1VY44_APLCA|nr:uncharacterized protein LOC101853251 isoform X2 [Aplysia californica]